jgi:hypothetical protein
MKMVLFQMERCPFCKHFRRMFYRDCPNGEELILDGHQDPRWVEYGLEYVPTVVAYDEEGKEIGRIGSVKLVGIKKARWLEWLKEMGLSRG